MGQEIIHVQNVSAHEYLSLSVSTYIYIHIREREMDRSKQSVYMCLILCQIHVFVCLLPCSSNNTSMFNKGW